jgi:4-amino-4-deoxy-L-arabinose transferase-like glycosyltransferase
MPAVLFLSTGAYVELPLAGFIFFSVRAFALSQEKQGSSKWLIVSGVLSGLAIAVKYTGAICPIILFLILIPPIISGNKRKIRDLFVFSSSVLLPTLPWLIKNALTIGNPVFPFFYQHFGAHQGWTAQNAAGYFSQLTEYDAKSHMFIELFKAPWNLSGGALRYGGGFDVLGDFGWPLIFLSAPLAIFLSRKDKNIFLLTIYAAAHFLFLNCVKNLFHRIKGIFIMNRNCDC